MNSAALRLLASLVLAVAVIAAAPTAHAQPAGGNDARARELYLRGDRLYNEGRYEEAVEAFRASYELSGRTLLLFNLANAYERLGRYEEALDALRRYAPDAPVEEEAQIRARIENLSRRAEEALAAERGGDPEPAPPPEAAAPSDPPSTSPSGGGGPDVALIGAGAAVLGVGAIMVVGGAIFGAMALDASAQLEGECADAGGATLCRESARAALDDEQTYALLADIGLFVGGAAALGGLVLLILGVTSSGDERAAVEPRLRVSRAGAELGLDVAF